nr:response regulator [Candidatus Poriferisodalis multihospitum]
MSGEHMTSVLVVDDEPSFTEALSVGLRREGFEVRTAADGRAALAEINEAEPDLVLHRRRGGPGGGGRRLCGQAVPDA